MLLHADVCKLNTMKNTIQSISTSTFKALLLFCASLFGHSVSAANLKVIKASTNRAIVELPAGMSVQPGQQLKLAGPGGSNDMGSNSMQMSHGSRANFVSLAVAAPLTLTGGASFGFGLSGGYGWNMGQFEFAPQIGIGYAAEVLILSAALQADINFVENRHPTMFVPGLTVGGSFAIADGSSALGFNAGLVGKLYVFKNSPTAIRLSTTFEGAIAEGSMAVSLGLLTVGLQTYF